MNTRIYNARILTMDGNTDLIDGEIRIEGERISYVGESAQAPDSKVKWDREIDAERNLVMPGFKDAHTHSAMTFLRSFADDLPLQEWLYDRVFPMEAKLKPEHILWFTKLAIMEYLTSGITAAADMYFHRDMIAKAATDTGFRMVLIGSLNDFGGTVKEEEEEFLRFNDHHELVSFRLGLHAEYTCQPALMEEMAGLVHKYKAPFSVHICETKNEVDGCRERYGVSPVKYFDDLGMFNYGGAGYHCVYMDDEDIAIFRDKGMYAVTNPASNLKLASGICPTNEFLKAGVPMAIGTDGAASNNCLDFFREMFLVTGLGKVREMDAAAIAAEEVLKMATSSGALAMGLDDCDCLAAGKKADLIMIDMRQPNMQPIHNPVKNLVYSGSKQNVIMTMISGKILYEKGQFDIGVEPQEIYAKTNEMIGKDF